MMEMERSSSQARHKDDCYFYYYSSCSNSIYCRFRHEPAALGNETVCSDWKAGVCSKPHCALRHLAVNKYNRSVTPCFWESQPEGCSKPHCPFLHQKPKDPVELSQLRAQIITP